MEPRVTEHALSPPARAGRLVENGVVGMSIVVFVEVMLFAGFISAYIIVRNSTPAGLWPPADQPRLPFASTAINTAMLLASGVTMALARRASVRHDVPAAARTMGLTIVLGGLFVVLQGVEWVRLIAQGLTLTSSQLGAFFYLIVGAHALHAAAALALLGVCWRRMRARTLSRSMFGAAQLFWYFVVLMWPAIYLLVYR